MATGTKLNPNPVSSRTIGRLSLYRRLLMGLLATGAKNIFSHQLAGRAGCTAAQVRRDLMVVGYTGSPNRGYDVLELVNSIGSFLDHPRGEGTVLVGVGNLGRAILSYFSGRRPKLSIVAAFDNDPTKANRIIQGCRIYPMDDLEKIIREQDIRVGIITVPAGEAQAVADLMGRAGVQGLLNFAPIPLRVPPNVYVEDLDMTMALEKVAYFARNGAIEKGEAK